MSPRPPSARPLPAALLMLALAGCSRAPQEPQADAPTNTATPARSVSRDPAPAPAPAPPAEKSVMRPAVVQETVLAPPPPKAETLTIGFPYDRSGLDEAARAALDRLLASPAMAAGAQVTVRGHSDTRGTDRGNHLVSARRARLVADYLAEKGVPRDRIAVVAMGGDAPLVPNARPDGSDDPEARARNRRVEIVATPPATVAGAVVQDAASNAQTDGASQ